MTTVVQYDLLNSKQHKWVANGCGTRTLGFLVPQLVFNEACNRHDFDYWLGFTEQHRKDADWKFLQGMLAAAKAAPWWKRWFYRAAAWRYWAVVRLLGNVSMFGKVPFHYRAGFGSWDALKMEMRMGNRAEAERRLSAAHKLRWVPKQPEKPVA